MSCFRMSSFPMSTARVRKYSDRAVLVEFTDPAADPTGFARRIAGWGGPPVVDVVPAAAAVLVTIDQRQVTVTELLAALNEELTHPGPGHTGDQPSSDRVISIDVRYDGPDLAPVAELVGCSAAEVVALHCEPEYRVRFCGFSPGFGYLTGLPAALQLPRLDEPRARVPAGSVGVAGEFTGVYPRASPGGWRLLGRTDAVLFDPGRRPPSLFAPGVRVRFRPV